MDLINAIRIIVNPESESGNAEEANKIILQIKEQDILLYLSSLIDILKSETENRSVKIEALILLRNAFKVNSLKERNEIRKFWLSDQFGEIQSQTKSLLMPLLFSDDILMECSNAAATISSIIYIEDFSQDIMSLFLQNAQSENKGISFVLLMTELIQSGLYSIINPATDTSIPEVFDLLLLCLNNINNPGEFPDIRFSIDYPSNINTFIRILVNLVEVMIDNIPGFFDSPTKIETVVTALFPSFSLADEFVFQQLYQLLFKFINNFYEMSTDFSQKIFETAYNGLSCDDTDYLTAVFGFYSNLIFAEYNLYYNKFPSFYLNLLPNFKPKNINLSSSYSHDDTNFVPQHLVSLVFGFSTDEFNEGTTYEDIPLLNDMISILFNKFCSSESDPLDTVLYENIMDVFSVLIRYFPPLIHVFFPLILSNISNMDFRSRYVSIGLIKYISDSVRCTEFESFIQDIVSKLIFEDLLHADEPPIICITLESLASLLSPQYPIEFEASSSYNFLTSILNILKDLISQQNVFENTIFVKLELINIHKIISYFLSSGKSMTFYPDLLQIIVGLRDIIITTEQEHGIENIDITDIVYACDDILIGFAKNCINDQSALTFHLNSYSTTNEFIEKLCGDRIFDRVNRISSALFVLYNLLNSILLCDATAFNDHFSQFINSLFSFLEKRDITLCENIFMIFIKLIQKFEKHDLIESKIHELLEFCKDAVDVGNFRLTSKSLDLIGYILQAYYHEINPDEFNQIVQNVFEMLTSGDNFMLSFCQPSLLKCINMSMRGSKSHFEISLFDQYANIIGEMMKYDINLNDEDQLVLWHKTYKEIFNAFPILIDLNPDIINSRNSPLYVTKIILFIKKKILNANINDEDMFHSFIDFLEKIYKRQQSSILRIMKSKETLALVNRIDQSLFSDQILHTKAHSLLIKLNSLITG